MEVVGKGAVPARAASGIDRGSVLALAAEDAFPVFADMKGV